MTESEMIGCITNKQGLARIVKLLLIQKICSNSIRLNNNSNNNIKFLLLKKKIAFINCSYSANNH